MQKIRSSLERSVLLRQSPLTSKGNRSITVFAGNPKGGLTKLETKYTLRTKYPMCHVPGLAQKVDLSVRKADE